VPSEPNKQSQTGDYSGTKAPENKEHVESTFRHRGDSLKPGGSHGARAGVGVSELDRDTVPNGATDPGQTRYDNPPLLDRDGSDHIPG
jgi:hypothetical protein